MKYHKIRNIALETCTKEQVAAYNIAFKIDVNFGDRFKQAFAFSEQSAEDVLHKMIDVEIKSFSETDNAKKVDIDAVFAALKYGLFEYMKKPFIATNYAEIGKAFPANYLKKAV